jgi:hypothetical protein
MTPLLTNTRWALAVGLVTLAQSCNMPPPSHALIVRHPELKCGLFMIGDCRAYVPQAQEEDEADAGIDDSDAGAE